MIDSKVKKAMIDEVVMKSVEFYEQWAAQMQDHCVGEISAHPEAMPPHVKEAIMLGVFGACTAAHIAQLHHETQAWAHQAMAYTTKTIDIHEIFARVKNRTPS